MNVTTKANVFHVIYERFEKLTRHATIIISIIIIIKWRNQSDLFLAARKFGSRTELCTLLDKPEVIISSLKDASQENLRMRRCD